MNAKSIAGVTSSITKVYTFLVNQNHQLKKNKLEYLLPFNLAYCIITKNFQTALQSDFFELPEEIVTLDVEFVKYYICALKEFESTSSLPVVWNKIPLNSSRPAFVQLLLGANAHINNDLPQALQKLSYVQQTKIKEDYFAADKIFRQSSREIIDSLNETSSILSFAKTHMRIFYERPVMAIIIHWRHKAWKNSLALRNGSLTQQQLTERSDQIADSILEFCS